VTLDTLVTIVVVLTFVQMIAAGMENVKTASVGASPCTRVMTAAGQHLATTFVRDVASVLLTAVSAIHCSLALTAVKQDVLAIAR
jgi:hypothetical protein